MAEDEVNRDCRMYEKKYPQVDDVVMVKVKSIAEMGAYVSLVEYNNIEGMILLSELSRRRIRSVSKLIRVGRQEVVTVLRVDEEKGYIDLSKRRVQQEDIVKMEEKWRKSKAVHSIMKNVAGKLGRDTEDIYRSFGWPLYQKFGHAYDAFKLIVTNESESVFADLAIEEDLKKELKTTIELKLAPQAVKIRADFEITCFEYEGIDAIKEALVLGESMSNDEFEVSIKLVAPPMYVITTSAMEKEKGIDFINEVCTTISASIKQKNGNLSVKTEARAVTEKEENNLTSLLERLEKENQEVDGDEDDE